jgi:AcrR family transcriptional regulator
MEKSEATRKYIIVKVAPIFNKKGFAGTTLSEMTRVTGLTKGSIYGNFQNKDEVALEAFRYNLNDLISGVNALMLLKTRSDEKLITFLQYYRDNYIRIFRHGGCTILNTSVDSDDGNRILLHEVKLALTSWKTSIEQIVEDGIVKQELNIINAERFACMFISMIEGSIMMAKTLDNYNYLLFNLEFLENLVKESVHHTK